MNNQLGPKPKGARRAAPNAVRTWGSQNHDAVIVDQLLKKLRNADPQLRANGARVSGPSPRPVPKPIIGPVPVRRDWRLPWLWAALGLALVAGLTQWPYVRACGFPLVGYGAVIVCLVGVGIHGARASWKQRRPVAHVVSFLVILAGLVFAAEVTLPRAGYANIAATWVCAGG